MSDLLSLDFMRRALVAALLVGIAAPLVGVFLVQRRLSLIGDGMGHVALAGVAVGLLTGQAPVLTALAGRRGRRRRHRADPRPRAAPAATSPWPSCSTAASPPVWCIIAKSPEQHPGQPDGIPLRRDHHHDHERPLRLRRARRASSSLTTWLLRPRLFAVANDEEYARASGLPVHRAQHRCSRSSPP